MADKCIATPPGEPDIIEPLTLEEETQRAADEASWLDPARIDAILESQAAGIHQGRAIDLTFLDGFWVVFKQIAPVGIPRIDDAVATDNRAAFNDFFKDQVKIKL